MKKLLCAVILLIIYGSLYPFRFSFAAPSATELDHLFSFGLTHLGRGDFIANVILFIPYGLLAGLILELRPFWQYWVTILVSAFVLALGVQIGQLFLPGRVPSGSDASLNLLGAALGGVLARLGNYGQLRSWQDHVQRMNVADGLALALIALNLFPFIPSIDLQLIKDQIKSLADFSRFSVFWTFQSLVIWCVVLYFLRNGQVTRCLASWFPMVLLTCLCGKMLIVANYLSMNHLVATLLAFAVWRSGVMDRITPGVLALVLLAVVIGIGLEPFHLRDQPRSFSWMPFSGALGSNLLVNVYAMSKKFLLYGSLIYLLVEQGWRLRNSTVSVAILLFMCEQLQTYFAYATPEITDSILALLAGWIIFEIQRAGGKPIHPTDLSKTTVAGPPK